MAKRRSKVATRKVTKKSSKKVRKSPTSTAPDTSGSFDDIDLLNAHRFPESFSSSEIAKIRNSRNNQDRLEKLLKGTPSGRKSKNKDISHLLVEKAQTTAPDEDEEEYEYEEYEYEYEEGESDTGEDVVPQTKPQTSVVKKFFRKYI